MLVIKLEKNLETDKLMVVSWYCLLRENIDTVTIVPGAVELVELTAVPSRFYKESHNYFYEDGKLRKYIA